MPLGNVPGVESADSLSISQLFSNAVPCLNTGSDATISDCSRAFILSTSRLMRGTSSLNLSTLYPEHCRFPLVQLLPEASSQLVHETYDLYTHKMALSGRTV